MTVVGLSFATSAGNTYRCQFEMSSRAITVTSAPVSASSTTRVICKAPAFPFAGSTVFRVITQTGSNVIKSGGATNVFVFALPLASIAAPAVFVMSNCGTLQTLTLTVTMSHPTSRLGVNSTRLVDRDTGSVVLSGQLAPSTPALQSSVNFTWAPVHLSADRVSNTLNFSVVVSEVDFALPDQVEVWLQVNPASLPLPRPPHFSSGRLKFVRLQILSSHLPLRMRVPSQFNPLCPFLLMRAPVYCISARRANVQCDSGGG